jgi:hypothetical protein
MGVVLKERKEVKALLLVVEARIEKDHRKRL